MALIDSNLKYTPGTLREVDNLKNGALLLREVALAKHATDMIQLRRTLIKAQFSPVVPESHDAAVGINCELDVREGLVRVLELEGVLHIGAQLLVGKDLDPLRLVTRRKEMDGFD